MYNSSVVAEIDTQVALSIIATAVYRRYSVMITTYRPHKRRRFRVHGFLKRMRTHGGQVLIRRRRSKGRKRISVG
jgi:large subunit ribosomal protein L34